MKNITCILTLIILNSCANLSSLQDGRTLKKGEIEMTPIVSIGKFNDNFPKTGNKNNEENYLAPVIGLRTRIAATKKIDAGILIDMSTNIGATFKYQFIGNSDTIINGSIGLDLGFNSFAIIYSKIFYYYSVPLYLSYNPHKSFAFYLTPRFVNNSAYLLNEQYNINKEGQKINIESSGKKYSTNRSSVSCGFLFGKKNKIGVEILFPIEKKTYPTNFTIGYIIKL